MNENPEKIVYDKQKDIEKDQSDIFNMNDLLMLNILENFSLKQYNTFNVNVIAKYFINIKSKDILKILLKDPRFIDEKKLILGGGSNILFVDNFDGLVIKIGLTSIDKIKENSSYVYIKAGSGVNWHKLVEYCIKHKYYGIENLSLIPGTVGGAPIQNIGAYGVELKDVFHKLEAINIETGEEKIFNKKECLFGYRDSIFKNQLKDKYIITNVVLKLSKKHKIKTHYSSLKEEIERLEIKDISLKKLSDVIINIRNSKFPDYKIIGNSGSFFKNPVIEFEDYKILKTKFPDIKGFRSGNKVKVSAGWLIEKAGWKGIKIGNVGTLKNHALVIINYGDAPGLEILNFAKKVYLAVKAKFKICLVPEVTIIISNENLRKDFEDNILKQIESP